MTRWKIAVALSVLAPALPAQASISQYGYVYGFQNAAGIVYFQTSGPRSGQPACHNSEYPNRWAFNATTAAGQAQLAIILSVYSLHKPLLAAGTGDCGVAGDTETVSGIATDNV